MAPDITIAAGMEEGTMPGLLPGAILYIIIPTGDGAFESAILHREAGMQGVRYGVLAILLAGHTGGMNMKTAVTGDGTGTTTHVIFRETDMTTGAMLKKTDATLKRTGIVIDVMLKKTGAEIALTVMVIDVTMQVKSARMDRELSTGRPGKKGTRAAGQNLPEAIQLLVVLT
jgi:hypothetical protein